MRNSMANHTRTLMQPMLFALFILFSNTTLSSQEPKFDDPPLVLAAQMPLYPVIARAARVFGTVKIKVTTDGKKVTSLDAVSGPAMLVKFTKANILTWEFAEHKPSTFETTYEYVIEDTAQCEYTNGTSVVNLPLKV